jgi:serine/threonine-protein kinase
MDHPSTRVGHYELLDRLGAGATGAVYRARRDGDAEAGYAVKVFAPSGAADGVALRRFVREAHVVAEVRHPHLARVREWVADGAGGGCLVMDLVRGTPLDAVLRDRGPRPLEETAVVVAQLASGLDHLHGRGVVHRDVKPANVVLAPPASSPDHGGGRGARADGWHATLVDYGAAKRIGGADPELTVPGVSPAPMTLLYASPEQCDGQDATSASDVYSLGVLAAEMLAGAPPFPPYRSANHLLALRLTAGHLSLREVCPGCDLPPGLQRVLDRALAEAPADRYPSAGAFAGALAGVARVAAGGAP